LRRNIVSSPDAFSKARVQLELARRGSIRDAIGNLPEPLREQAWKDELERRRLYNEARQSYHTKRQASVAQALQPPQASTSTAPTATKKTRRFFKRTQKLGNLN